VDPQRKRKIRLSVALGVAVILAAALIYTSFTASTDAKQPSQLLGAAAGTTYQMTGTVVPGSVSQHGETLHFRVTDRAGEAGGMPVTYAGTVPDPFRGGRQIVLSGEVSNGTFVGQRNSLITKCPSKYTAQNGS
jgi:cytochrome c-type biogenesis protein CcmE